MDDFDCPTCHRIFESHRGLSVHHTSMHDEQLPNRECDYCGLEFYSEYAKKYCSESCLKSSVSYAGKNNPNYEGGKRETDCEICGESFEYYPSNKRGKYCQVCVEKEDWREIPMITGEDHPRWNGGKQEYDCAVCGDTIERHPSGVTGDNVVCSTACHSTLLSEQFTGEGHPNWEGGGRNEAYGTGWREIRQKALQRDRYKCVNCGKTSAEMGRNPDVHHLKPVREFIDAEHLTAESAHTLDNVVCLCIRCHRKADFGQIPIVQLKNKRGQFT